MNEIEKRELFEQQRKIFEAGTQRADKRTGFFSFLTWPFFMAPLIASEEFRAATFNSVAAKEQDTKAVQLGAAPHAANDDLPASDPSKASAENETARGPAASSEAHAAQLDQIGLLAQSDEGASRPSAAGDEAFADTSSGGGGGGAGSNDADTRQHGAHTSTDDGSDSSLSADSHIASSPVPGGSTLDSVQFIVPGVSSSLPISGSPPPLGPVGGLGNDVMGGIAPVETPVQPLLTTVTETMGTLTHDVAGTLAPVEAAVQPTTVTDTVATLTHDAAGTLAPVEAAVQPLLTTVTDTADTLTHDVVGTIAPVEAAVQPLLATVTDTMGTLTHDVAGTTAPVEAAVQPLATTVTDTAGTLPHNVAGTLAPVEAAVQPALTTVTDTASSLTKDASHPADAGNGVSNALASAAPVVDTTEPVLASVGVSHSNPATDPLHSAVPDISTGQAAGPADTLLALATSSDAPIEVPGSATAAPANVGTGTSNAAATVDPTAIVGDVIALNEAPAPPAHALFTGSQYTDYGITLSSDIAVPAQHAVSPTDTASAHEILVPVVADVQKNAPPPPDIVDTTHSIDHLGHAML